MIVVTVRLISANDGHRETLGRAIIYNDATGSVTRGNYHACFWGKRKNRPKHVRIQNFPRKQKNVWWLLKRALNEAYT